MHLFRIMVVARLPNPLNQALANRTRLWFWVNWGVKISVAFGAISDAWDKCKLYYQKKKLHVLTKLV